MRILIHACPERLWYVNGFLLPELSRQGIADAEVWTDGQRRGNLLSCMASFAARSGDGDTWHLQDDVWPSRDFARRAALLERERGILCGFVSELGGPDCNLRGRVYVPDMWYSFPCVRIPDALARGCAEWFFSGAWRTEAQPEAHALAADGRGDDWFFREYAELHHAGERALNLTPCLAEHVDWLVGGSQVSRWRGCRTPAVYWDEGERVEALKAAIRAARPGT